jgi:hypothetical protein
MESVTKALEPVMLGGSAGWVPTCAAAEGYLHLPREGARPLGCADRGEVFIRIEKRIPDATVSLTQINSLRPRRHSPSKFR